MHMQGTSRTPWTMHICQTVVVIKDADGFTVAQLPITGVSARPRRILDARLIIDKINQPARTAEVIPLMAVHRTHLNLVP